MSSSSARLSPHLPEGVHIDDDQYFIFVLKQRTGDPDDVELTAVTTQLKRHMLMHNGQKPFACNQCSYTCTQAVSLEKHMLTHSGEKPFSCNECDYKCRDANNLKTHKFTHTGEKPFACKQCNYSCKSLLPKGLPF